MSTVQTHRIQILHTDSGIGGWYQHASLLEVVATDPREPTPPTRIEWGCIERYHSHVDLHDTPVACTLGVRYTDGLASCLRAWGCRVVQVLATSLDKTEATALMAEVGAC